MDDQSNAKKTKERSPTFPFITLEHALERARQFYAEEKRGVAPLARAALHWRYSEASSGLLQTLAALKNYGLLIERAAGAGKERQVQLSDLALRIILDQRPDSQEREDFIRKAAMTPAIAAEVYSRWSGGLPSDSTLNHFLVLEKKFNEATALRTSKILKENQLFAKIFLLDSSSLNMETSEEISSQEDQQMTAKPIREQNVQAMITGGSGLRATAQQVPSNRPYVEQLLHLDGATTITIQFSDTPTAAMYDWIADFARMKSKALTNGLEKRGSVLPNTQSCQTLDVGD